MVNIPPSKSLLRQSVELKKARKWGTVLSVFSLMILSPTFAKSQPTLNEQIKKFRLLGYSSDMRPSPFSGQTMDGNKVSLSQFRGRVLLVNFFATWCSDCRPEMPMFEKLHMEFSPKGLVVLGVNVREGSATIKRYAKELGLTFPLVLDPQGKISRSYGVIGLPTTFLIARDGRPVALAIGPRKWDGESAKNIIRTLLSEPTRRQSSIWRRPSTLPREIGSALSCGLSRLYPEVRALADFERAFAKMRKTCPEGLVIF